LNDCREKIAASSPPSSLKCKFPDQLCSDLPDYCFNSLGHGISRKSKFTIDLKSSNNSAENCKYGDETWLIRPGNPDFGTECRLAENPLKIAKGSAATKNVTFICQMCYMAENSKLIFDFETAKNDVIANDVSPWPRCRTMSRDPLFEIPHMTVIAQVKPEHFCFGSRVFKKKVPCNLSSGKRWSTACALSIVTGGLGIDRFYLFHWRSGIAKILTFGGLGVWTLVDIFLVCTGYMGPADGTVYAW